MNKIFTYIRNKDSITFVLVVVSICFLDFFWIHQYDLVPAWDQGFHLSNLYKYSYLIKENNIFSKEWWEIFWSVTDNYRGPITYILSGTFLNITGITLKNAILSNTIFNLIISFSIYKICIKFFKKEIGLWAIFLFSFNPYIFNLRNDYLIDLSQLAFICINFLFLSQWYFSKKNNYKLSFISGASFGLLFLAKPTAIFYFLIPILLILKKITSSEDYKFINKILILSIYIFSFVFIIYPWVSINWLTLLTSTINAWNWGLKYQDGFEINTLQGWIFYPFEIIKISNPTLIFTCLISNLFFIFKYKPINFKLTLIKKNYFKKCLWFFSLPLNIIFLNLIMTTKDTRFIIPLLPLINIFTGFLIYSLKNKYNFSKFFKITFIFITLLSLFISQINVYNDKFINQSGNYTSPNIIHKKIIEEVHKISPNINSTIGFIPDTKNFNAFNLDAEAIRQNKGIRVMQIVSNKESFKDDINNFDWFILKTGDQGIMTNKAKMNLSKLLFDSEFFKIQKKWKLIDNSEIYLLKKNILSEKVNFQKCKNDENFFTLKSTDKGLKIHLFGKLTSLSNSKLIIDIENKMNFKKLNFSVPKIIASNDNKKCIEYTGFYNSNLFGSEISPISNINGYLVNGQNNKIEMIKNVKNKSSAKETKDFSLRTNKIDAVNLMGNYLKNGEFDKLFNLVGLINQSDPEQKYLNDAEIIFKNRLSLKSTNLNDLYALAISQILQRKANPARQTLNKIITQEKENGNENENTYLAKCIVEIYLFDFNNANKSIAKSILINSNKEIEITLNKIYSLTKYLKFINIFN